MALASTDYHDRFRLDLSDPLQPGNGATPDEDCLWSSAEVFSYLNDAQMAVARKTLALRDVLDLPVTVGQALYTLPSYVLRPRKALVVADNRPITLINGDDSQPVGYDYGVPKAPVNETATGPVESLIFDERTGKIRTFPIPTVAETVRIYVFRLPKTRIKDDTCALELTDERYESALLCYMKKRAYEKQDADTLNKQLAEKFEAQYLIEASELIGENKRRVRRPSAVRYGGL